MSELTDHQIMEIFNSVPQPYGVTRCCLIRFARALLDSSVPSVHATEANEGIHPLSAEGVAAVQKAIADFKESNSVEAVKQRQQQRNEAYARIKDTRYNAEGKDNG